MVHTGKAGWLDAACRLEALMPSLPIWALTVYWLSFIVAEKDIAYPARKVISKSTLGKKLIGCFFCVSFWCACLLGMLGILIDNWSVRETIKAIPAGAAASYLLRLIALRLELKW